MNGVDSSESPSNRGPGCLAGAAAIVGVVLLAPMAVAVRTFRGWLRGSETRIRSEHTAFANGIVRVDLSLDVQPEMRESVGRSLTDIVVRVAETLRRPDDVYHLIYRERGAEETMVLPVGPLLQELGERFHLVLSQEALALTTCVWLTLARDQRVVEMLDPFDFDPESPGEPEALLTRSGMRWGMGSTVVPGPASVLFRLVLFVPKPSVDLIDALFERLPPASG